MWYTYSSVDAVPHRMWVKPRAFYTLGYQNIWVSLQSRENTQPTLLSLVFSSMQTPLGTQLTLTTFKFFLPPLTHTS